MVNVYCEELFCYTVTIKRKMEELIMSNYGRCKDCEWGEPESGTWKWYCSYYKTYEDPDEVQDCKQFKERGSSSGGCF